MIELLRGLSPPKKAKGKKGGTAGIFELSEDTLTLNFAFGNKPPTDFTSTAENKNFVVVYKRKK